MNADASSPHRPTVAAAATFQRLTPAVQNAVLGLQNSRAALRMEMLPPSRGHDERPARGSAVARLWWRRLRAWPAGRAARELVRAWWHRHPWQPLGDTLLDEARALVGPMVGPMVRRHPWAAVGAAAAVGAGVVAARPWRWEWLGRHVRRAPDVASSWLIVQLGSAPVQAALAGWLAMLVQDLQAADRAPAQPAVAPVGAGPMDAAPADRPTPAGAAAATGASHVAA